MVMRTHIEIGFPLFDKAQKGKGKGAYIKCWDADDGEPEPPPLTRYQQQLHKRFRYCPQIFWGFVFRPVLCVSGEMTPLRRVLSCEPQWDALLEELREHGLALLDDEVAALEVLSLEPADLGLLELYPDDDHDHIVLIAVRAVSEHPRPGDRDPEGA